ncbi:unnamed protein product [Closterium sp. Naga37s-1]|nr:unnamed protein product [Closterium sp. Naga37s-1]
MVVGGLVIGGTVIGGAEAGEGKRSVRKAYADGSRWLRGKAHEGKRVVPLSFRASMFLLFAGIMMVAVSFKSIPSLNKGKVVPAGEIVNGSGFQSVEKALSEGQGEEGRGVKGRSGDGDGLWRTGEVNGLSRRGIGDGLLKKRRMKAESRGGAGSGDMEGEDEYRGGESEGDGAEEETREGRRESGRGGDGGSGEVRRTIGKEEEEEEEAEAVGKIRRVGATGDSAVGEDEETGEHRGETKDREEERLEVGAERKREDEEDVEGAEGEGEGGGRRGVQK